MREETEFIRAIPNRDGRSQRQLTERMEIDALRQIPLADFLARLGHEPLRMRGNEWWYAAPYRTERTPSFRVNVDKQLWYDFGLGKGGDIFTLAGEFVRSSDFMEQVKFITEAGIVPLPQIEPHPHKTVEKSLPLRRWR